LPSLGETNLSASWFFSELSIGIDAHPKDKVAINAINMIFFTIDVFSLIIKM